MRRAGLFVAALAALGPARAEAHLVGVEFGDFYAGALHLLTAPADVALLMGLALVTAVQPRETGRWSLAALPIGLVAGIFAAALTAGSVAIDPVVALVLAAAGLAATAALRMPAALIAALAAGIGLLLGLANGTAAVGTPVDWWLYGAGVVATGTFLGTMAVAGMTALREWQAWVPIAQRVVGSWLAAVGAMVFALAVAG